MPIDKSFSEPVHRDGLWLFRNREFSAEFRKGKNAKQFRNPRRFRVDFAFASVACICYQIP